MTIIIEYQMTVGNDLETVVNDTTTGIVPAQGSKICTWHAGQPTFYTVIKVVHQLPIDHGHPLPANVTVLVTKDAQQGT